MRLRGFARGCRGEGGVGGERNGGIGAGAAGCEGKMEGRRRGGVG